MFILPGSLIFKEAHLIPAVLSTTAGIDRKSPLGTFIYTLGGICVLSKLAKRLSITGMHSETVSKLSTSSLLKIRILSMVLPHSPRRLKILAIISLRTMSDPSNLQTDMPSKPSNLVMQVSKPPFIY